MAPAELAAALALAPEAVAADGGGDHALPEGHAFRAVIGDMDSLTGGDRLRAAGVPIHAVAEQETTDLEKCLYSVAAPLFIGLGFLGGRIDHHLAAMNALAKNPEKPVVLIGGEDLCFLCPRELRDRPRGGDAGVALSHGAGRGAGMGGAALAAPRAGFRPDGRIGTSNVALGGRVRMAFDAPRMLVILPAALLGPVAERLRGAAGLSSASPR